MANGIAQGILLAFTCCMAVPSHAITLYRGDDRPPDVVFREGFVPQGTNESPLDHISGRSCLGGRWPTELRSAYVALSEHVDDTVAYGTNVYHVTPDLMAPDSTATFDVVSSLRFLSAHREMYALTLNQTSAIERLATFSGNHGQHMSRRIPPEWILAADIYEWDDAAGRPRLVRTEWNTGYRAPAHIGSESSFTAAMIAALRRPPPQLIHVRTPGGDTVPVCLTFAETCAAAAKRRGVGTQQAPLQCEVEPLNGPSTPYGQALQLLLGM